MSISTKGERVGLSEPLAEIQDILDQARTPDGARGQDEAIAAIARLIRSYEAQTPVYQKALG